MAKSSYAGPRGQQRCFTALYRRDRCVYDVRRRFFRPAKPVPSLEFQHAAPIHQNYLPLRLLIIIIVRPRLEVPVERLEPREVRLELAQLRVRGLAERVAVAPEDRQVR